MLRSVRSMIVCCAGRSGVHCGPAWLAGIGSPTRTPRRRWRSRQASQTTAGRRTPAARTRRSTAPCRRLQASRTDERESSKRRRGTARSGEPSRRTGRSGSSLPRSGQELVNARKSRLCNLHARAMPAQELSSVSRTSANAEYQHSGRFVKPLELTGQRKSVATGQVIVHDCPQVETGPAPIPPRPVACEI